MGVNRSRLALFALLALLCGQAVAAAGVQRVQLVRESAQRQARLASSANEDEGNVRLLNYMDAQVRAERCHAGDRSDASTFHTRGSRWNVLQRLMHATVCMSRQRRCLGSLNYARSSAMQHASTASHANQCFCCCCNAISTMHTQQQ
jgi:hypothetical protein